MMKVQAALQQVNRLFLDSAPVIYYVDMNPAYFAAQDTADFVEITSAIARQAAEVRARYNLQLPDAFQIATALATGCDTFLTNDAQLKRVSDLRVVVISELEV